MEKHKKYSTVGKVVTAMADTAMVLLAFYLAYLLFAVYHRGYYGAPPADMRSYAWILLVLIPSLLFLFNHYGLLTRQDSRHFMSIAFRAGKAFLLVGIVLSGTLFLAKAKYYSRLLLALIWLFSFGLVLGEKLLFCILHRKGLLQWGTPRHAILVGQGDKTEKAVGHLQEVPGVKLLRDGTFDLSVGLDDFRAFLLDNPVDEVYFVLPRKSVQNGFKIDDFMQACERMGVAVHVVVNMIDVFDYFSIAFGRVRNLPTLVFQPPALDPDRMVIKRIIDIAGALVGLAITAVLTPIIAAAIKIDSEGPVFFRQERVGQNGRRFTLYKFRSMHNNAEEVKPQLEEHNEMDGPMFKMRDDPRITRVGKILRWLSVDELPQMWNVLKGDMSLVGTRPPTPEEVEDYEMWHYRRISIKPGITGLWQVSGRQRVQDFSEVTRLDLDYIDRASLWLDMKILFKTILVLAKGR
ncbi:MAG: sugar transferase [Planctomycetota bacterium]